MRSAIVKRSVMIAGRKTSVSLEDAFWIGLKDIGKHRNKTLTELVCDIAHRPRNGNLSSAVRLFVLDQFRVRHPATPPIRSV